MSSYSATCQVSGTGYASTEPFYKRYSSGDILSGVLNSLPTTERLTDLACRMTKALSIITVFKYGVYYVDKKIEHGCGQVRGRHMIADHIDLLSMVPLPELSSSSFCLANRGSEYLVYLRGTTDVTVNIDDAYGSFRMEWFNTGTGEFIKAGRITGGRKVTVKSPSGIKDAVLYLVKIK